MLFVYFSFILFHVFLWSHLIQFIFNSYSSLTSAHSRFGPPYHFFFLPSPYFSDFFFIELLLLLNTSLIHIFFPFSPLSNSLLPPPSPQVIRKSAQKSWMAFLLFMSTFLRHYCKRICLGSSVLFAGFLQLLLAPSGDRRSPGLAMDSAGRGVLGSSQGRTGSRQALVSRRVWVCGCGI